MLPTLKTALYVALTLVCLPPLLTGVVDPSGVFQWIDVAGFNREKTKLMSAGAREAKSLALLRGEFDTLLLGSSRSFIGLDPESPVLGDRSAYDASLGAVNMCELYYVFDYALRHQRLRTLIFSVDFLSFSGMATVGGDFRQSGFGGRSPATLHLRYLYGQHTLRQAAFTVWTNLRGRKAPYTPRGSLLGHRKWRPPVDHHRLFMFRLEEDLVFLEEGHYAGFVYGPDRLEALARIFERCRTEGIAVYAFISPVHARQLETLRAMSLYPLYEQWKRDLVQRVERIRATHPAATPLELWDFSGYNSVTVEPVPPAGDTQTRMRWYWEHSHYTYATGDMVLSRMFQGAAAPASIPDDFGVRLTSDTIEAHQAHIRQARARYAETHPADIAEVETMFRDTAARRPSPTHPDAFPRGPQLACRIDDCP